MQVLPLKCCHNSSVQDVRCRMNPAQEMPATMRFALMLESACSDFETLAKLIRKDIHLAASDRFVEVRALATVRMALARSFVFHVVRSRRICEAEASNLKVTRENRKRFLAGTEAVLRVRDVNEHGFDPPRPGKASRPTMHLHVERDVALDETSLNILGEQEILMGPLNLYAVYMPVDRMRQNAGFGSLPRELD